MKVLIISLALTVAQFCVGEDIPCGKQAPGNEPIGGNSQQQYIEGGIHAKPHSWPWAVAILNGQDGQVYESCGATIVDKRWVLTAAHCAEALEGSTIKIGADDRGDILGPNEPTQQVFKVEKYIVNPKYNQPITRSAFDTNLVKLDRDIEFNDNVRPICLPEAAETLTPGEWATTIGWGAQDHDQDEHKQLQQIKLPVIDVETCDKIIQQNTPNNPQHVLESCMICAGYDDINNSSGVFAGDSGSALMAFHDGVWKLYGVTSWRYRESSYMPGVWAYVPKMVDWIKQTIQSG